MFRFYFFILIFLCLGVCSMNAQNDSSIDDDEATSGVTDPIKGIPVSRTLPVLYIETENRVSITSKTEYVAAKYWLETMGTGGYEAIGSEAEPLDMQIRGRGHSSWKSAKKPYKIKLADKLPLLGMPKNKHWALLKSNEATVAGLQLGKIMDMAWTSSYRPVEVVLNGVNIGLYFLTETIRIGKNRVNIYEQEDYETNPSLICGGWLVEVDNYHDTGQITFRENSKWNLTLKYHSPENLSTEQLQWLTDEFKNLNEAVYSSDKTSTKWEEYMDVESMAKFFIIQEVMDNPDGFHGSFYLHKDLGEGAKWVAGPIWDLVCYNREKTDYTFRMNVHYTITPHWIGEIIQYDSFCKAVKALWEDVYPEKIGSLYDYIDANIPPLYMAWEQNRKVWDEDPQTTAYTRADNLKNALHRNIEWFNEHLPISQYSPIAEVASDSESRIRVYNLQGVLLGEFDDEKSATSNLKSGIYIINGKKYVVK